MRDPDMGGGDGMLGVVVLVVEENALERTGKDACTLVG